MGRKRFMPEQIIQKLRQAEVGLAQGRTTSQDCKELGITEQTYCRWRREYGGLRLACISHQRYAARRSVGEKCRLTSSRAVTFQSNA